MDPGLIFPFLGWNDNNVDNDDEEDDKDDVQDDFGRWLLTPWPHCTTPSLPPSSLSRSLLPGPGTLATYLLGQGAFDAFSVGQVQLPPSSSVFANTSILLDFVLSPSFSLQLSNGRVGANLFAKEVTRIPYEFEKNRKSIDTVKNVLVKVLTPHGKIKQVRRSIVKVL